MPNPSGTLLTRLTMEIAVGCAAALAGALVCYGSLEIGTGWGDAGPQPGYFPFYIGLFIVIASCAVLIEAVIEQRKRKQVFLTREQGQRILSFSLPMLGFVAVSMVLGLYVGLALYLFGAMTIQGGYRIGKALLVCSSTVVIFYFVFEKWFQVSLLKGPLEALLHIY
jgi:Tripartite tricarboxylate transporter TctB family